MKYAVMCYSESGNTEMLAREIFRIIDSNEKLYVDLKYEDEIPDADVYFLGFPVLKQGCSLKVIECMEQIKRGKVALFATCGMYPTEKYKEKLEDSYLIWLPDGPEYLGMFLCQGKTTPEQKVYFCQINPYHVENIKRMLDEGDLHPNEDDLDRVAEFVEAVI